MIWNKLRIQNLQLLSTRCRIKTHWWIVNATHVSYLVVVHAIWKLHIIMRSPSWTSHTCACSFITEDWFVSRSHSLFCRNNCTRQLQNLSNRSMVISDIILDDLWWWKTIRLRIKLINLNFFLIRSFTLCHIIIWKLPFILTTVISRLHTLYFCLWTKNLSF